MQRTLSLEFGGSTVVLEEAGTGIVLEVVDDEQDPPVQARAFLEGPDFDTLLDEIKKFRREHKRNLE